MNRNYTVAGIAAIAVIAVLVTAFMNRSVETETGKLSVVASFYPLAFFAEEIGGDQITVRIITPAGAEPHEYEPTPQEMLAIEHADVLLLNGAGFEGWGDDAQDTAGAETLIVTAGEGLATLQGVEEEHEGEENGHEEELLDPHVWLSPVLAMRMIDAIRDGFIKADPEHEDDFRANAGALAARLATLDAEYRSGLSSCARNDIITSHAAFGYVANAYGLRQVAIRGVSTEEEPSAQDLAEIAEFARANDVKYIFFETLVSPKLSQTLAKEVGAATLVLNPLEGLTDEELNEGKDYLTEMRANLQNLRIALECR